MSRPRSEREPTRLRGVVEVPGGQGESLFRATIGKGQGRQVNLGLYPTRWQAAFAYNTAAEALHGGRRPANEIPGPHQPTADQVRRITVRVRRRLGLEGPPPPPADRPPPADELLTLLEVTVAGFWRGQVAAHASHPRRELDVAARRLVEAARLLFWSRASGHPTPLDALTGLLALRLDRAFRRADLTRAVLDDDGDDELRVARWLVQPDDWPGGRGFREALGVVYAELLGNDASGSSGSQGWAEVLGVSPPFTSARVRAAYRSRSKAVHPDAGGDPSEFVRLREAYEEARRYCASRGI